ISAVTNGGTSISFPAQLNILSVSFTIPKSLPTGQYLVRIEALALHSATTFQGAQWYISCGQVSVTGGGSGKPGPLVSIPGVYTGNVRPVPARHRPSPALGDLARARSPRLLSSSPNQSSR
ncbi:glycosyl hydrolase family 61-domain-containing protein, partial [Mycena olivaceomarginata]